MQRHLLNGSRFGRALLLALALSGVSCIDLPGEVRSAVDVNVVLPEGIGLESTCTPTGVEICFDARDNNCNGVIDEGCGLRTGLLQFVIAWEAPEADVDLLVTDPSDEVAKVGEPTAGGLVKDRDCPRSECQGQNVENVFLGEGEPRKGKYKVVVHLERLNGATAPVRVRVGMRIGLRTHGWTVELTPGPTTEDWTYPFEVK